MPESASVSDSVRTCQGLLRVIPSGTCARYSPSTAPAILSADWHLVSDCHVYLPRTNWSIGTITILYIYYLQRAENASPYKWLEAGISVLHGGFHRAIELGWIHHYRPKGAAAGVWKAKLRKIG